MFAANLKYAVKKDVFKSKLNLIAIPEFYSAYF